MRQMPMTTEMTTLHRTYRLRGTAHWAHSQVHPLRARIMSAHKSCSLCTLHPYSHFAQVRALSALHLTTIIMAVHVVVISSTWFPLFTSSLSSCPSSSSPSSTSATSSSRSSTRRSWKTCATPRQTGVMTLMTSSTSPQVYEPNGHDFNELQNFSVPLSFKIPAADQDVDDLTLGEMLTEAYRGQVDYFVQEGMSVSQLSSSVRFDRSGQLDGDRSGQPDECNSSKAQIRTLLEEQRQTVLAECNARVSHHELQAAQAEEERRLFQGQLWQQKLEFREAHQRSLTEMEELRKFPESCLRYYGKTKIHRGSEHYLGTLWQSTGIAKWSKLFERF